MTTCLVRNMAVNPACLPRISTALEMRRSRGIPSELSAPMRDPELTSWFAREARSRISALPQGLSPEEIKTALEMPNRLPEGSVTPLGADDISTMAEFVFSAGDILDRAKNGTCLLSSNGRHADFSTAVRGMPAGGASTRASEWAFKNAEAAALFGFGPDTPRYLYRAGGRTLLENTVYLSSRIGRAIGKIIPNIVMTNSETVGTIADSVFSDWGNYPDPALANSIFFNQVVMPRIRVKDGAEVPWKLFPAGHGDFPYLMAKYNLAKTLARCGFKYLIFSNADEWTWQADPVIVSIADEVFKHGDHHMIGISMRNLDFTTGGGPMRKANGKSALVELMYAPYSIVKEGKPPEYQNTTFFCIDIEYMAENEEAFTRIPKCLVVKNIPGETKGSVEQIIGVDSASGDVFTDILNPLFIFWPRLNYLYIKDGKAVTSMEPSGTLHGRSHFGFLNETLSIYPNLMDALISGERWAAEFLHRTGYSYLDPER